jgi:DNA-binding response OmpR family regulator
MRKVYKSLNKRLTCQNSENHGMRILIIDDNKEITDMLSFYLENLDGYECKVANDASEGLQTIRSEDFDLVILDLAMPEFSGIDVINSLRKEALLEKNRIIVLTASSIGDEDIENLQRHGVRAVVKKPVSLDELTAVIDRFKP